MSKPNLLKYASEIRKEGEAWKDAVERAKVELHGTADDSKKPQNRKNKVKKFTGASRQPGESPAEFRKRKNARS